MLTVTKVYLICVKVSFIFVRGHKLYTSDLELADPIVVHNETTLGRAWGALIGPALNLVGSLFGSNRMLYVELFCMKSYNMFY